MPVRVLLVEDETDIVAPLVRALEREGYAVEHAATGGEALAASERQTYDVVVLDVGLPDIDGLEVCRRLRAADFAGAVLILSARTR